MPFTLHTVLPAVPILKENARLMGWFSKATQSQWRTATELIPAATSASVRPSATTGPTIWTGAWPSSLWTTCSIAVERPLAKSAEVDRRCQDGHFIFIWFREHSACIVQDSHLVQRERHDKRIIIHLMKNIWFVRHLTVLWIMFLFFSSSSPFSFQIYYKSVALYFLSLHCSSITFPWKIGHLPPWWLLQRREEKPI